MRHIKKMICFFIILLTAIPQTANADDLHNDVIFRFLGETQTVRGIDENHKVAEILLEHGDHILVLESTPWNTVKVVVESKELGTGAVISMTIEDLRALDIAIVRMGDTSVMGSDAANATDEEAVVNLNFSEYSFRVIRVSRMTYCYRYVKKYLLKVDLVDTYLPGASAYQAATILPEHGFKKINRGPYQVKKHDVCVYRGGPSGHGHIEIMTTQGWYYGYGYKKNPIQNRTLIGCFAK